MVQGNISQLEQSVAAVQKEVCQFQESLAIVNERLHSSLPLNSLVPLEQTLTRLQTDVTHSQNLRTEVEQHGQQLSNLSLISAVEQRLDNFEIEITRIQQEIKNLVPKTELQLVDSRISNATQEIKSLRQCLHELSSSFKQENVNDSASKLKDYQQHLEQQVINQSDHLDGSSLDEKAAALWADINELQVNYQFPAQSRQIPANSLDSVALIEIAKSVTELQKSQRNLEGQMKAGQSRIDKLHNTNNLLQKQVNALDPETGTSNPVAFSKIEKVITELQKSHKSLEGQTKAGQSQIHKLHNIAILNHL